MPNLIVFDTDVRRSLLPLTYSRPVGDLRLGILTIREKWEHYLCLPGSFLTVDSLQPLFPVEYGSNNLLVNGSVLPTPELATEILSLNTGQAFQQNDLLIAACLDEAGMEAIIHGDIFENLTAFELQDLPVTTISCPGDLFALNDTELRADFDLLTQGRSSADIADSNTIIGPRGQLFVEEGVNVEACVFNLNAGPIYLAAGAIVLEGSLFRGPISIAEGALVKMGAKLYGATSVGPRCKVGGEINNVIFHSNSNKGHDGYLGNAVIGQWCNIGADTNASNLRNDYGEVRVWSYTAESRVKCGRQFHGLIMGDHSKLGINSMLNTGTVIGFSSNVFGEGFPPGFIPSFSWGGASNMATYRMGKALETASRVFARRGKNLTEDDQTLFKEIFEESAKYRSVED